jgi:hypothetical protein
MPDIKYASLTEEQLAKLRELEADLGNWVLAIEPAVKLADLTPSQLARIQALEEELGIILLAYHPSRD